MPVAAKRLRLTVLTPAGVLLDVADVTWVQVPLADGGSVGIYPGHAPLLAETRRAPLRYATATGEHRTEEFEAGILQVRGRQVLLLTGGAGETARAPAGDAQQFERLLGALLIQPALAQPTREDG
mgnify:CR=1 FL=1|jgi:F0F1-type ATP synthase epsilon subunit